MAWRDDAAPLGGWRSADDESTGAPAPGLRTARRGAVPLRIAPLVVVGLIFVVLAVLAATTL